MAEFFDPYYQWLGIPPGEQPPHYYRLLGLRQFEPDSHAIAAAADQLAYHIRGYQVGPYLQYAQKLLAEVAAARACLLDPPQRAAYDQQLSMMLAARQPVQGGGAYAAPFDAQLSPERPLMPPPPPGCGGPAMPVVDPYADPYSMQPPAPVGGYAPPMNMPPTAYPPSIGAVPSAFPQGAVMPPNGGYPQQPPSAPASYAAQRPTPPAPYPGSGGAESVAPPSVEESIVDELETLDEESSSGAKWRRKLRHRGEEPSYAGIIVGVLMLVLVLGIILARHPIDSLFFDPPPTPAAPAVKPRPPAPIDSGVNRTPGSRKPGGAPVKFKNIRGDKSSNSKPGDLPARPRSGENRNSEIPAINLGEPSGL